MPGSPSPSPRILLVEDDASNAEIARVGLLHAGYDVTWVAEGEAAVAAAQAGGWDLIVLDMHLPGLDGLGVALRLRADPALAGVRILGLSALASRADREAAAAAGVDAYLTKPYRRQELLEAVAALLGR